MHENRRHARKEFVIFDETNPRSLVRLVPEQMAKKIRDLGQSEDRYLLGLTEPHLLKELTKRDLFPGPIDRRLRLQFWFEFDRIIDETQNLQMNMAYVVGYTMSKEAFYNHYIQNYGCLAYLICPPTNYEDLLYTALEHSLNTLMDSLKLPTLDRHGRPNTGALKHILAVEERIQKRVKAMEKTPAPPAPKLPSNLDALTEVTPEDPPEPENQGEDNSEALRKERQERLALLKKEQSSKGTM